MNRFVLGLVLLTAACGGKNGATGGTDSLCTGKNPPAACQTACNPVSGAADCPDGFHCAASGKCDAVCTSTGDECGAGNSCTTDGLCQQGTGDPGPVPIDAACPAIHFTPAKVTPSIELVFDKSQSMNQDFDDQAPTGANDPVKFDTEKTALVDASKGIVAQLQNSAYFGIQMFPGASCQTTFSAPRALGNATAIGQLIGAHGPSGNTPTSTAIDAAVKDFHDNPPPAGSPPIIVLSTDGEPNDCNGNKTTQPSIDSATAAFNAGIKLFVLTVGNHFPAEFAQALASAGQGGQAGAKAFSATDPATMAAAFQQIIGGAVSCDLTLDKQVQADKASQGIVTLGGKTLVFGTDWKLDADGKTIHLLGTACTNLKNTGGQVDATFPCGSVIL
jgi:hypothetical protein